MHLYIRVEVSIKLCGILQHRWFLHILHFIQSHVSLVLTCVCFVLFFTLSCNWISLYSVAQNIPALGPPFLPPLVAPVSLSAPSVLRGSSVCSCLWSSCLILLHSLSWPFRIWEDKEETRVTGCEARVDVQSTGGNEAGLRVFWGSGMQKRWVFETLIT